MIKLPGHLWKSKSEFGFRNPSQESIYTFNSSRFQLFESTGCRDCYHNYKIEFIQLLLSRNASLLYCHYDIYLKKY